MIDYYANQQGYENLDSGIMNMPDNGYWNALAWAGEYGRIKKERISNYNTITWWELWEIYWKNVLNSPNC